jgi:hypothetical protein
MGWVDFVAIVMEAQKVGNSETFSVSTKHIYIPLFLCTQVFDNFILFKMAAIAMKIKNSKFQSFFLLSMLITKKLNIPKCF